MNIFLKLLLNWLSLKGIISWLRPTSQSQEITIFEKPKFKGTAPIEDCSYHFHAMFEFLSWKWSRSSCDVTLASCCPGFFLSIKTLLQKQLRWNTTHLVPISVSFYSLMIKINWYYLEIHTANYLDRCCCWQAIDKLLGGMHPLPEGQPVSWSPKWPGTAKKQIQSIYW